MEHLWHFIFVLVVLEDVASYKISDPYPMKSGVDSYDSDKTITDETLRALLGQIKDYVSSVQLLPDETITSNTDALHANVSSRNAQITDLTMYDIDTAHADMSKLEFLFKLTFPLVNVSGQYNLYSENNLFVLRGHGNFSANVTELSLSANLTLALNSNQTLEVKNVSTDFDFKNATVNFENLGEDKDVSMFLNDFINQFIVESMKDLKPIAQEEANDRLTSFGGFLVQNMSLDEFIDFINGLVPT